MKKKILVVFGTRPEAIKMCPIIVKLKALDNIGCCVCLTGQHKEMLAQVMEIFKINADYNLDVMENEQTLKSLTNKILIGMDRVLCKEKPDMVLVHGDTTSSFAASLAAFYQEICIGHVEAGLRTYNIKAPFPEEYNRQAVDMMSSVFFAPTIGAKENLLKEGKNEAEIYVTGNTVIDTLKYTVKENFSDEILEWAEGSRIILLTAHRRENIGKKMKEIFCALKNILHEFSDVKIIFPVHKNPYVREIAMEVFKDENRIKMIEPLDVISFHNYMAKSYLILTDSGGIQEEAPSLGKPVLVMRDATERPEGIEAGVVRLVGTSTESVYQSTRELLLNQEVYNKMSKTINPYGDGYASDYIVDILRDYMFGNA